MECHSVNPPSLPTAFHIAGCYRKDMREAALEGDAIDAPPDTESIACPVHFSCAVASAPRR